MGRPREWPPRPHAHRPSGQERVRYKGTDHYLGPIGSLEAKRAYLALIETLEAAGETVPARPAPKQGDLSVAEVVAWFLDDADARYSRDGREVKQFEYSVVPLVDLFGSLPVVRFGVQQLEAVREEMIRRNWNRGVINRRVIRLRTLFRRAETRGKVLAGTWSALRALEPIARNDRRVKNPAPKKAAEWKDLARVCRFCPPVARDLLLVLYWTGARPSELIGLKARDIVRTDSTHGEVWTVALAEHKNAWRGQSRVVMIGPKAQRVILRRLASLAPGDYVFAATPGKPYESLSFSRAVARACERAGVKVTPYSMRHSAKARVTRECGLDAARAMLGQASLQSTDKYASGQDERLARDAARKTG